MTAEKEAGERAKPAAGREWFGKEPLDKVVFIAGRQHETPTSEEHLELILPIGLRDQGPDDSGEFGEPNRDHEGQREIGFAGLVPSRREVRDARGDDVPKGFGTAPDNRRGQVRVDTQT